MSRSTVNTNETSLGCVVLTVLIYVLNLCNDTDRNVILSMVDGMECRGLSSVKFWFAAAFSVVQWRMQSIVSCLDLSTLLVSSYGQPQPPDPGKYEL